MGINRRSRAKIVLIGFVLLTVAACSDNGSLDAPGVTEGTGADRSSTSTAVTTTTTTAAVPSPDPSDSTTAEPGVANAEELLQPPIVRDLQPLLMRIGVERNGVEFEVMYEPSFFFRLAEEPFPASRADLPIASFVLHESVHIGELPAGSPIVHLIIGEGPTIPPTSSVLLIDDGHHRTTRLIFGIDEELDAAGVLGSASLSVTIVLGRDGDETDVDSFLWRLPLDMPARIQELIEGDCGDC